MNFKQIDIQKNSRSKYFTIIGTGTSTSNSSSGGSITTSGGSSSYLDLLLTIIEPEKNGTVLKNTTKWGKYGLVTSLTSVYNVFENVIIWKAGKEVADVDGYAKDNVMSLDKNGLLTVKILKVVDITTVSNLNIVASGITTGTTTGTTMVNGIALKNTATWGDFGELTGSTTAIYNIFENKIIWKAGNLIANSNGVAIDTVMSLDENGLLTVKDLSVVNKATIKNLYIDTLGSLYMDNEKIISYNSWDLKIGSISNSLTLSTTTTSLQHRRYVGIGTGATFTDTVIYDAGNFNKDTIPVHCSDLYINGQILGTISSMNLSGDLSVLSGDTTLSNCIIYDYLGIGGYLSGNALYVDGKVCITGDLELGGQFNFDSNLNIGGWIAAAGGIYGDLLTTSDGGYKIGSTFAKWGNSHINNGYFYNSLKLNNVDVATQTDINTLSNNYQNIIESQTALAATMIILANTINSHLTT